MKTEIICKNCGLPIRCKWGFLWLVHVPMYLEDDPVYKYPGGRRCPNGVTKAEPFKDNALEGD